MKKILSFIRKPYIWAAAFSIMLSLLTVASMLEAFVIPRDLMPEINAPITLPIEVPDKPDTSEYSDYSYSDENISIEIDIIEYEDTACYVADIKLSSIGLLKTMLAKDRFGRHITENTSSMAERADAIFAVNGDYYGFRADGYVIRNGILYRSSARPGLGNHDLMIDYDGNMTIFEESSVTAESCYKNGAYQLFTFGPGLVEDGKIVVDSEVEVGGIASERSQRTGLAMIEPLHYLVIVCDGRTKESPGLTLLQFANLFTEYGCDVAYNLDGGDSSTMWFNGKVLNNPTPDGGNEEKRTVSDCVYIGY